MHGHLNVKFICCVVSSFLTFEELAITTVFTQVHALPSFDLTHFMPIL